MTKPVRSAALLAMVMMTMAAACTQPAPGDGPSPSAPAPQRVEGAFPREVTLSPGGQAVLAGEPLRVTFLRVTEDSRCPRDAQCVRAGEAKVELMLTMDDRVEQAVIHTAGEPRTASLGPYTVEVVRLEPVPTTAGDPKPEEYRATLRIAKP